MIFTWPLCLTYGLRRRNRFVLRFCRPRSATGDLRWRHLAFYVFTCRSALPAPFGDSIFRCTAKDRGERRASSSQAPHPSFCLSGQKLSRSAAPPLPTKPTSLGFGGAPVGGPLDPRSNVLDEGRRARILRVSPKGTSFGRAGCNLRDLGPSRRRKLHILRFAFRGKSSVIPLLLLSPPNPLRWALAGPHFALLPRTHAYCTNCC